MAFLFSFFFIFFLSLSLAFFFSLIRLHRKSELSFVCNGESRKGEGARSTALEGAGEREGVEEEEGEDKKGPESGVGTKEGDEEEDAERRRIQSPS